MNIPTDIDPRIERTRRVVLEATAELIGECGFSGTSIGAISDRSGVARSTIYRHWPERADLLLESMGKHVRDIEATYTGDLRRDLLRTFDHICSMLSDSATRSVVASFVAESTRDPELAALNSKFTKVRREASKRVIDDAVSRGDLPSDVDSTQMADDLAAGIFFRGLILREPIDAEWLESHVDRWISTYSTT